MFSREARIAFAMFAVALATHATEADQPPSARDSKVVVPSTPIQEPEKPGRQIDRIAAPAGPAQPAGAGGAVVFIDPATGKIVQPSAAQIGTLSPVTGGPVQKAPTVTIQGPGGAVGIRLTPESFSYSVATLAPDGKLVLDCVTGEKAAAARVAAGESPGSPDPPRPKNPRDDH